MDEEIIYNEERNDVLESEHELLIKLVSTLSLVFIGIVIEAILFKRAITLLPTSGVFIALGAAFSGLALLAGRDERHIDEMFGFKYSAFILVLLPPIIFAGAFNLKQRYFWGQIWRILTFALVGTALSTLIVAVCLRLLFPSLLSWPLAFAFGALISAVDPVACLSTYQSVGANHRLFSLVYGESTVNDAVAIVLFKIAGVFVELESDGGAASMTASDAVGIGVEEFLLASLGSIGVGVAAFVLFSLLFKYVRALADEHEAAALLIILGGHLCFLVSELVGASGILATLTFGFGARHYAAYSVDQTTRKDTGHFANMLAKTAETAVYVLMGIAVVLLRHWHIGFVLATLGVIIVARAVQVFVLSAFLRACGCCCRIERKHPVSLREQMAMIHAGLRGAVAFALVLAIPGYEGLEDATHGILRSTTLLVVIFTVFTSGATTASMLKALRLRAVDDDDAAAAAATADDDAHRLKCRVCASHNEEHVLTQRELAELRYDARFVRPLLVFNGGGGVDDALERALGEFHPAQPSARRPRSRRKKSARK